jgi:tol-pal system protein YbgF
MRMKLFVAGLLLILAAVPAFSQNKDMLRLQADMINVQQLVKELQSSVDKNNAAMMSLVEKIADSVNTLATGLTKVTQAVDSVKSQSDASTREMRTIMTNLNSTVGDLQESLNSIRSQVGSLSQQVTNLKTTAEPLAGPNDLWKQAVLDALTGQYEISNSGFQEFLQKSPGDARAADAHLRMGENYSALKKYDQAETEFDFVLQKYPDSDTTRAALLKKGLAQAETNPQQAKETLTEVVKKYPNTAEAQSAQAKLKDLTPAPRGRPNR